MKRTALAILLISAIVAVHGCGVGDPGQPPAGSISVGSKSDEGPKFGPKRGIKAAKTR